MAKLTESHVEEAALEWLGDMGWQVAYGNDVSPDSARPERAAYGDVLLLGRLREAVARLNPAVPEDAREDALRQVVAAQTPSLVEENRRLHRMMVEGVPVEYHAADGVIRGDRVRLIDFGGLDTGKDANDWLAINQFTVIEAGHNRRPDIVLFVNGLPLAVVELKNPGDENATMDGAFNQLQTYKQQIASLFRTNALLVISDGLVARAGSLTADEERFMPWRTMDGATIAAKGLPELEVLLKGVFDRERLLVLMRDFTVFGDTGNGIAKIVAGYHQYFAAQNAIAATLRALPSSRTGPKATGGSV
jgi:type I restriction enzyme R subunit